MKFKNQYKCLSQNKFSTGEYKIIPLRFEDRLDIMNWRNEQMYHLRQDKLLTEKSQEDYFNGTVAKHFDQEKPNQILFSFLQNGKCIGYGGLVHINWLDKNAEISFIMKTELEKYFFLKNWEIFLKLLEQVAFVDIKLFKIYSFAFNLRPQLYTVLEHSGFSREAVLKNHTLIESKYVDVIIHSKFNKKLL